MTHPHGDSATLDPELAQILDEIVRPRERFAHRHHIHLAFLAVRHHGMPEAVDKISDWIRQIAAQHGTPQLYHHTITRAWVELVAHHVDTDPDCTEYETLVQHHPALLDKYLLSRHYRAVTLAAAHARSSWTDPDLVAFPWAP